MKFDCRNKFDLRYYGQVNWLRLKSSVARKGLVNTFKFGVPFILLAMVTYTNSNYLQLPTRRHECQIIFSEYNYSIREVA